MSSLVNKEWDDPLIIMCSFHVVSDMIIMNRVAPFMWNKAGVPPQRITRLTIVITVLSSLLWLKCKVKQEQKGNWGNSVDTTDSTDSDYDNDGDFREQYQKSRVDWSHGLSSTGGRQLQATITVGEQSVAYARDRRFVAHGARWPNRYRREMPPHDDHDGDTNSSTTAPSRAILSRLENHTFVF